MRAKEKISETGALSLRFLYNTRLGRILLKPLICRPVSTVAGKLLSTRASVCSVRRFISKNRIDMTDYGSGSYRSFNDFFTRKVLDGKRPIDTGIDAFVSPCDARLSLYPIETDSSFTVKGVKYTVAELLENDCLAAEFTGGYCFILRLAVDNYHRYGWCADGNAAAPVHINGKYHTVQPIAMRRNRIFRENVREYTVIETEHFGKIIQIEVGALMVGRICNNSLSPVIAEKGKEKGRFNFGGSTIIVLTSKNAVIPDEEFLINTETGFETHVKYGERIALSIQ